MPLRPALLWAALLPACMETAPPDESAESPVQTETPTSPATGTSTPSTPPSTSSPSGTSSSSTGSSTSTPPIDPSMPRINEVLASNDSVLRDEDFEFDDWVELYNPTPDPIDLTGWMLGDSVDGDPDWVFPKGTLLDPYGHLLVWLDGDDEGLHANFSLSADNEDIVLFGPDGDLVDSFSFTAQSGDVVLGRFPDGGVFVTQSIYATPGGPNPVDPGLSKDPSDLLFPTDQILRVDLYLDEDNYDELMDDNDAEVMGAVELLGTTIAPVLVTIKGGYGSNRDLDEKAAFRLNLDRFVDGQRLRGLEHLTFNNMVQDPSGVHEDISYQLFRDAGVPACRVAHVELYLNGDYRGLYLHVETNDDQFIKRHFEDPNGNLYEGAYGADVTPWSVDAMERDELGSDDVDDRSEIEALTAFLEQPPSEELMPAFENLFDVDRTLKMLAGEVVIEHWDGYFYSPNNFRLYHEPSLNRWTLIPWGLDQTLVYDDWWGGGDIHGPSGKIADWCLAIDSCKARYNLALWEMAERLIAQDVEGRVAELHDRILPYFDADPYKEASTYDMENAGEGTIDFVSWYPEDILYQLFPEGVP